MLDAMIEDAKRCNARARAAGWYPAPGGNSHFPRPAAAQEPKQNPRHKSEIYQSCRREVLQILMDAKSPLNRSDIARALDIDPSNVRKRMLYLSAKEYVACAYLRQLGNGRRDSWRYVITDKGRAAMKSGALL